MVNKEININEKGNFIIYEGNNGELKIEVKFENENIWLSQDRIGELFGVNRQAITKHLQNIFSEGELMENSTCSILELVHTEGTRKIKRSIKQYNLDAIIAVGYRINSKKATQFRIWATNILKEYLIKGFTMDDDRLKKSGGGNYWKELLDRIRDIRSSEKAIYRQVLDLYSTSIDYNPKSTESEEFFKIVQNKLHYATSKNTAAELIYNRADSEKKFMGLTTFTGDIPVLSEVKIAKNYLTEDELFRLNRMVSAFFDLAELKAQEKTEMKMSDWIFELDKFASLYGKGVLENKGSISNQEAIDKAITEYRKYQVKTLSKVESDYLDTIKNIQRKIEKNN